MTDRALPPRTGNDRGFGNRTLTRSGAGEPELHPDCETPLAVVDLARTRANLQRTAAFAEAHGIDWRPHVKTHKSPYFARMQIEAGARGLTVATPREAEIMSEVTSDLLLAHPPVGPKARRLMELPEHVSLRVALDSAESLRHLSVAADDADRTVGLLVEVDLGMGRVGVQAPPDAVSLAQAVSDSPLLRYDGILFYPGHIRSPADERLPMIRQASDRLKGFLDALDSAGLAPGIVSGGSTPTLYESHLFEGITEIRPGTSIFHDRDTMQLGIATLDEIAYWIEATVVSTARPGRFVVDAGSKALAKESFRGGGGGFGIVMDRPHLTVSALSEEHGIVELGDDDRPPRVGDRIRIIPNHVCVSVNLQDQLLVRGPDGSLERLPIPARGRLRAS